MRWLSKPAVRTKLIAGFLVVATFAAVIGSVGVWATHQVRQMAQLMYQQEVTGLRHAAQAQQKVTSAGLALHSALLATDKGQRIGDIYFMRDSIEAAGVEVNALGPLFSSEDGQAMATAAAEAVQKYATVMEGLAQQFEQASMETIPAETLRRVQQEAKPLGEAAGMLLGSLMLEKQNTAGELAFRTDAIYTDALQVLLALTLGGALMAIILGMAITRDLMRQLGGEPRDVALMANRIAGGDLTVEIQARKAHPESMIRAMANMQTSLRKLVGAVRENSENVATGARHIAAGNQALSSRTDHQASQLTETAAAMEELSATVKSNAEDASKAAALASSASDAAIQGVDVVRRVVSTMGGINASSARISEITSIIDSIGFQTNILALNAAVEAARAGEQGRGFAVVASEVRSLAQKSAAAARDIKALIDDSQDKVDSGMQLVQTAGESMNDIVSRIKSATELINAINVATQEQNVGLGQINAAVASLSVVTEDNATSVEQSAQAAARLDLQAGHLVELVRGFVLQARSVDGPDMPASVVSTAMKKPLPNASAANWRLRGVPVHAPLMEITQA